MEHAVSEISQHLKKQIIQAIRETNYAGSIEISMLLNNAKLIITRREIISRTKILYDVKSWPTSFSILKNRPECKDNWEKLKEEVQEDACSIKVFWPQKKIDTHIHAESSRSTSKLPQPLQQSKADSQELEAGDPEEAWMSAWRITLQNAVIESNETSQPGLRTLFNTDQNDANVIGLRRRPPKKAWGGSLLSVNKSKLYRKLVYVNSKEVERKTSQQDDSTLTETSVEESQSDKPDYKI